MQSYIITTDRFACTSMLLYKCYCHPYYYTIDKTKINLYIIKKQLSRTVVRELLPRATTHGHQTFPDYGRHTRSQSKGGDVREEAPAEERAAKILKTTVRHLGFTEKIYGFPRTFLCCQYKRRTQPLFANSSRERR